MIFENNLTLSDGSKISTRNYNISSTERYVEFVGSKTCELRLREQYKFQLMSCGGSSPAETTGSWITNRR